MNSFLQIVLGALATYVLLTLISKGVNDDTDDPNHGKRSGIAVYTDYGTGNQYLAGPFLTSLTPRIDQNGKQVNVYTNPITHKE